MTTRRTILRTLRIVFPIAVVVVLLILPWTLAPFTLSQVAASAQIALVVLSLNLLVGMAGQISLGQAAFVGVGAYTVTVLVADAGMDFALASVIAVVVSAFVGLLVGLPSLRLKGVYVALSSIGIAIVFPSIIQSMSDITGGTAGKSLMMRIVPPPGLTSAQWVYLVSILVVIVAFVLVRNIKESRMGYALRAIRDNQLVSETFGVQAGRAKLVCFMISAGLAGAAGCLFALQRQFVSPADFGLLKSIDYFVGMAVGGQSSVMGAAVGGVFLEYAPQVIREIGLDRLLTPLIYGVLLVIVMISFRHGIAGAIDAALRRWAAPRLATALPHQAASPETELADATSSAHHQGNRREDT